MGLTRTELFSRLGLIKIVEPAMQQAAEVAEEKVWRLGLDNSPHGQPWHTSFHASSFPGDDPMACMRREQYVMMDAPKKEPAPQRLMAQAEVGKAVELMLVRWFGHAEVLLSANQTDADDFQTNFEDDEHWLTGSVDLIIIPEGWDRPHVVEVKTKKLDVVREMKWGQRDADPKHVRQCKAYIGFAHENAHLWPHLKPCQDGSVFYLARDDDPSAVTHEFFYSYDKRFMEEGRERLAEARDAFLRGELLPHVSGGKGWSTGPCQFCDFKKHCCKPDEIAGVAKLRDSHAIPWAESIRPDYDYDKKRKAVLDRWGADNQENE